MRILRRPIAFTALVLAAGLATARADGDGVDAKVVELLRQHVEAPTSAEQLEASLVALGAPAAARLRRVLEQTDESVPVAAVACALARIEGAASVVTLARLAQSTRDVDREAAVAALAEVPVPESMAIVLAMIDDELFEVARAAANAVPALVERGPELGRDRELYSSLREKKNRELAGSTLGRLGNAAAHDALLKMLATRDPDLASAALNGLWDVGGPDDLHIVRPLVRGWTQPSLRKKACLLVGRLHDAEAVVDLIDAMREEDPGLAANACWALREITGQRLEPDPELWAEWWERGGREQVAQRQEAEANAAAKADEPDDADAPMRRERRPSRRATIAAAGGVPLAALAVVVLVAAVVVLMNRRAAQRAIQAANAAAPNGRRPTSSR